MRRPANLLLFLGFLLPVLGQQGCSRAHERVDAAAATTAPPVLAAPTSPVAVVNLPLLVGRSIDELRRRLGPAQQAAADLYDPVGAREGDSTLIFQPHGLTVVASYDAQSRRVFDLLVLGTDEDVLMRRTHLVAHSSTYLLLPVFALRPINKFVGLRVVPHS